eukprot:366155-Chlamydomonas_euryale.AAC.11
MLPTATGCGIHTNVSGGGWRRSTAPMPCTYAAVWNPHKGVQLQVAALTCTGAMRGGNLRPLSSP